MNQYQGRESCALPANHAAGKRRARVTGHVSHAGRVDIAGSGPFGGETS